MSLLTFQPQRWTRAPGTRRTFRVMRRHLLALAVASVLITSAGCSAQTTVTSSESTSSAPSAAISSPIASAGSVPAGPTTVADNTSAAPSASASSTKGVTTSSAAPAVSVVPTTTPARPTSRAATKSSTPVAAITAATKPPTAAQIKSAQAKFAALAKTAFPDVPTETVVSTAKSLCTTLGQGSSLHDEVGQLAGQVHSQAAAEDLVRAAVGAYCPTVTLH